MTSRHIYRPPRSLSEGQQDALARVWSGLKHDAIKAKSEGRPSTARLLAEDARRLVDAFGVRYDGRRHSPFPHQPHALQPS